MLEQTSNSGQAKSPLKCLGTPKPVRSHDHATVPQKRAKNGLLKDGSHQGYLVSRESQQTPPLVRAVRSLYYSCGRAQLGEVMKQVEQGSRHRQYGTSVFIQHLVRPNEGCVVRVAWPSTAIPAHGPSPYTIVCATTVLVSDGYAREGACRAKYSRATCRQPTLPFDGNRSTCAGPVRAFWLREVTNAKQNMRLCTYFLFVVQSIV